MGKENCPTHPVQERNVYAAFIRLYNKLRLHEGIILKPAFDQLEVLEMALRKENPAMLELNRDIAEATERSYKITKLRTSGLLDADAYAAQMAVKDDFMKLKSKIAALAAAAMMATSALSMSASAITWADWGDNFFTPNSGSFYASNTQVFVKDLRWSADNLENIRRQQTAATSVYWGFYTAEFEFRPVGTTAPAVWEKALDLYSNLPSYFSEPEVGKEVTDPDDVTIGCGKVSECSSSTSYYTEFDDRTLVIPLKSKIEAED